MGRREGAARSPTCGLKSPGSLAVSELGMNNCTDSLEVDDTQVVMIIMIGPIMMNIFPSITWPAIEKKI